MSLYYYIGNSKLSLLGVLKLAMLALAFTILRYLSNVYFSVVYANISRYAKLSKSIAYANFSVPNTLSYIPNHRQY